MNQIVSKCILLCLHLARAHFVSPVQMSLKSVNLTFETARILLLKHYQLFSKIHSRHRNEILAQKEKVMCAEGLNLHRSASFSIGHPKYAQKTFVYMFWMAYRKGSIESKRQLINENFSWDMHVNKYWTHFHF